MTDEYATDRRVALDPNRLRTRSGIRYLPVTTSTQAQVKDALDRGTMAPVFVITEEQTAGRGRLDRTWTAPPFSSVLMSVGLSLSAQPSTFTLRVGVAVAEALSVQGVQVLLKWPNDIVVVQDGRIRKLGGILAEVHREHVVVGIGLNIDLDDDELPTPDAISCRQLGNTPRRERLIDDIIDGLSTLPQGASLADYRRLSATIGADVAVSTLVGAPIVGTAIDVDADGALLVREPSGVERRITVGDVRHVRPGAET